MPTITVESTTFFNDRLTPIQGYLNIRDFSSHTFLCESAEYLGSQGQFSILGAAPIAGSITAASIKDFLASFTFSDAVARNGFYGTVNFPHKEITQKESTIHELYLFEFLAVFNHKEHLLTVIHNYVESSNHNEIEQKRKSFIRQLVQENWKQPVPQFRLVDEEQSDCSDAEFIEIVKKLKLHVQRGDIFQVVPSRRFQQKYSGDCFHVYRALRVINPSPYLFYLQFGDRTIFGSSPEAAILVNNRIATLNPIAGTAHRSEDRQTEQARVDALLADAKEASEHVMLVDLARNDLSKNCYPVTVKHFRDVHYYSHVIHLVSAVEGQMAENISAAEVFMDTFPAGTVSGAPKIRAMELIAEYEKSSREFYAGSVGFFGTHGDAVQALAIRTFHAADNTLTFRAGAGVVIDSVPEKELLEVQGKLQALRNALRKATTLHEIDLTY